MSPMPFAACDDSGVIVDAATAAADDDDDDDDSALSLATWNAILADCRIYVIWSNAGVGL